MYRNETCARYTTICMTSVGGTDATFLAPALAAIVGADARPRALLALGPAAVMLAHLRSTAFLAWADLARGDARICAETFLSVPSFADSFRALTGDWFCPDN